ncbi:MAG: ChbG/HpnK family deacetylase [Pseudomonadota bacterium]
MGAGPALLILTADDYAMTEGVSRGIRELAAARRLSATSAMTSMRHWPEQARAIAPLRDRIAVGLHLNLTLGAPIGAMPRLARSGTLPPLGAIVGAAIKGAIDAGEVRSELERQLDAFEAGLGHPPDHVDGHQHVHALPGIARVVAETIARRYPRLPPLVRNPADRVARIVARRTAVAKALTLAWLSRGLAAELAGRGLPTNDSFSGVTDFEPQATARDLGRALLGAGAAHLVMCHPGYPDAELASLDPVTARRLAELRLLAADSGIGAPIWHAARAADGPAIDWHGIIGAVG